jgi:hypothetical protein
MVTMMIYLYLSADNNNSNDSVAICLTALRSDPEYPSVRPAMTSRSALLKFTMETPCPPPKPMRFPIAAKIPIPPVPPLPELFSAGVDELKAPSLSERAYASLELILSRPPSMMRPSAMHVSLRATPTLLSVRIRPSCFDDFDDFDDFDALCPCWRVLFAWLLCFLIK